MTEVQRTLNLALSELEDVLLTDDAVNKELWVKKAMQFISYAQEESTKLEEALKLAVSVEAEPWKYGMNELNEIRELTLAK